MALRIQIAKFKFRQYLLRTNSPNLMLTKLSHYMVVSFSDSASSSELISQSSALNGRGLNKNGRGCKKFLCAFFNSLSEYSSLVTVKWHFYARE